MNRNYGEAWAFARTLINNGFPFPQHQGKTDITEVIPFQDIAHDFDLSTRQYDALIDKAQKYHDAKDKIANSPSVKEHPYAEIWEGNVKDLVRKVRYSDARYSAIDAKSGAHIFLNLDSDALMYIESPDGENLHDALNMKEAEHILSAYRKGKPYLI